MVDLLCKEVRDPAKDEGVTGRALPQGEAQAPEQVEPTV